MPPVQNQLPPIDDNDIPPRRPAQDEIDDMAPPGSVGIGAAPPPPPSPLPPPTRTAQSIPVQQDGYGIQPTSAMDPRFVESNLRIQNEHWIKAYWRPAMGWLYMLICFVDFVIFPAMTMFLPAIFKGFGVTMQYSAWQSLTLSNGGLMHIAFGAILGVAAWARGQEKMSGLR
jgi:hypothetical protein